MNRYDRIRIVKTFLFTLLLCPTVRAEGGPSKIESVGEDVLQVGDEAGNWGGPTRVRLFLSPEDVTCLAVLPRRISVVREGHRLNVEVNGLVEDSRVNLCDRAGNVLSSAPVEDRRAALVIDESDGKAACVKLCRDDLLLDVVPVPAVQGSVGL